eukprot:s685_g24.t1
MGKMECMVSVDCLDESFLEEKATDWQDLTRFDQVEILHALNGQPTAFLQRPAGYIVRSADVVRTPTEG